MLSHSRDSRPSSVGSLSSDTVKSFLFPATRISSWLKSLSSSGKPEYTEKSSSFKVLTDPALLILRLELSLVSLSSLVCLDNSVPSPLLLSRLAAVEVMETERSG